MQPFLSLFSIFFYIYFALTVTPDDFPNDDDIGSQVADFSPAGISGSPNGIRLKLNVIFLHDKSC